MALLPQPNNPSQPLNQKIQDFSVQGGAVKTANSALALVIQDTQRAEKFILARLWMSEWRVAKTLYEAPVKQDYWRNTFVPRASNSFPLIAQHVRAILDQTMMALFPEVTPFAVEPETSTPRQVARGWEHILSYQLREASVKQQMRLIAKDCEVFGTGFGKWGWESYTEKRTMVKRAQQPEEVTSARPGGAPTFVDTKESDELDEYDVDVMVSRPYFRRVEINHLLVSPDLREPDIRRAQYVIYRSYPTLQQLAKMREEQAGYDIPSDEELKKLAAPPAENAESSALEAEGIAFPTQGHRPLPRYYDASQDPTLHKLEMLEYWTADKVIVVLQRKIVIRNESNPFGVIPFLSAFWDDLPGTFYGFGIPRRIGGIQTHIQGLRNLRMDDIHLNLMKMWKTRKGSNISAQPIKSYPGAIFKVDQMSDLELLELKPVNPEAWKEEEVLISDAEKTTGANELLVQGAMPSGSQTTGMRTGTGSAAVAGASSARVQSFVNTLADQVLVPVLYSFLKMNRLWLEPKTMRKIVGATIWKSMTQQHEGVDLLVDMYNESDIEFKMLAGSNIAARVRMAQQLPLLTQMFESQGFAAGLADSGVKINWLEVGRRMEQASGWDSPEDIFIPLTDQDKQARAQQNPKALDIQATRQRLAQMHQNASQLSAQEHAQNLQEIDAKGMANAGEVIATRSLERAAERAETPEIAGGFGG